MREPVQAQPMPRKFMQEIVGRQWSPLAKQAQPGPGEANVPGDAKPKGKRRKKPDNPCLVQLTTFAARPCRCQ